MVTGLRAICFLFPRCLAVPTRRLSAFLQADSFSLWSFGKLSTNIETRITAKNANSRLYGMNYVQPNSIPIRANKCRRTIIAFIIIFVTIIFIFNDDWSSKLQQKRLADETGSHKDPQRQFRDFSSQKTRTFHMVCLENIPIQTELRTPTGRPRWYRKNKTYRLPYMRSCSYVYPQKVITIYSNVLYKQNPELDYLLGFNLTFKPADQVPASFAIVEDETAYFLGYRKFFEPMNFFHFTKQIYFPLYRLIKSTNQLQKDANNIVFYPKPHALCTGSDSYINHDIKKFQYFRDILHVKNKLELSAHTDKKQPDKVCYRNAVFSSQMFLANAGEAIRYFKNSLKISNKCQPNVLTIINRHSYRRILNTDQLEEIGIAMGFDAKVVEMETLTLKEQAQVIHCTKILVGVTGAGLQWAYFTKDHSRVVEIAWPHHEWPFFFSLGKGKRTYEKNIIRPLHFVSLSKVKCVLNPRAINIYYKEIYYLNRTFSPEESLGILQDKRNYNHKKNAVTSLGKLYDVIVDPSAFQEALNTVA